MESAIRGTARWFFFQGLPLTLASVSPAFVWPLGDTTGFAEVIHGHDATKPSRGDQCFLFESGPPQLPYRAIRQNGRLDSQMDIIFRQGDFLFRDVTFSIFVYPESDGPATLINYRSDIGHHLKVLLTGDMLFVSFWDVYGVSVGVTALSDVLQQRRWTHLVVSRQYSTGTIKIYRNSELLQELDDDFPNEIPIPQSGLMRLGGSADSKTERSEEFHGRITCFQMYAYIPRDEDVEEMVSFCRPNKWVIKPEVLFTTRTFHDITWSCLNKRRKSSKPCDTIGLHCLTGSDAWRQVLAKHNWADGNNSAAYFHIVSLGGLPDSDQHLLGSVNVTMKQVCPRLCMRVLGCKAFAVASERVSGDVQCFIYDSIQATNKSEPGFSYYVMRL